MTTDQASPRSAEEAGSGPSASAVARAPKISKLHMESMERHGGVNRHPEIKSNQLEVASWHSNGGMSATNPSNRSIRLVIHPSIHAAAPSLLYRVNMEGRGTYVCGGQTEIGLFWWMNKS